MLKTLLPATFVESAPLFPPEALPEVPLGLLAVAVPGSEAPEPPTVAPPLPPEPEVVEGDVDPMAVAWNAAKVFSAVGFNANTIPPVQCPLWAQ